MSILAWEDVSLAGISSMSVDGWSGFLVEAVSPEIIKYTTIVADFIETVPSLSVEADHIETAPLTTIVADFVDGVSPISVEADHIETAPLTTIVADFVETIKSTDIIV